MAHAATGLFSATPLAVHLVAVVPDRFRLTFEYEPQCVTGLGAAHAARFTALSSTVEFSTTTLLATAALRHFGTSYHGASPAIAMAKELVLWWGWLGTRGDGALRLDSASNAGRLAEVAASLGEAVALDLAINLFNIPLAHWFRIPESGGETMDFKAPGASGDIAIEAKGGHGSVVADRKEKITRQKAGQTKAAEKYGFILCYEMAGRSKLKRKGSHVKIVDPPGDPKSATPIRTALLQHYWQLASSIGLTWLERYLAAAMDANPDPDRVSTARGEAERMLRAHDARLTIRGEKYLGHYFDVQRLLVGKESRLLSLVATRYFFFGIANRVIRALLGSDFEQLIKLTRLQDFAFAEERQGPFGPVLVTGLSDGVVRVDFVSLEQVLDEGF